MFVLLLFGIARTFFAVPVAFGFIDGAVIAIAVTYDFARID